MIPSLLTALLFAYIPFSIQPIEILKHESDYFLAENLPVV
jgi:hypothetical protein